ncbi:MAG TPA: Holliday junction resolvase RuvX [Candidatus Saccharimonadales bacterium]|nr:Holliday junction resolvase RuvX [Candidatus Saccharimonadales bacterium]
MRPDSAEEYIGVDVGGARVGISRGSSAARLAEPLKTVGASAAIAELKAMARESGAAGIVVGLPRSLNGDDTAQTGYVRRWISEAKKDIGLPFYIQDEALTSRRAESGRKQPGPADAEAAALILQDFLDTPKEERVRC